jgi:heat shock protein HslJ
MKNVYLALAVLVLAFTSCKNADATDENETAIDTTAIQQESMATTDSLNTLQDSTATQMDSASTEAGSNVKLPNKISTTEKVIPGEKGKFALAETKWKLIELNGNAVDQKNSRDYFINFDSKSGTFKAFVGCNRISGSYFMKATDKVGFTNIITTRMACNDNNAERDFFNGLQKVDNYMIEGKMMHLHVGKKAVAKFEAIR